MPGINDPKPVANRMGANPTSPVSRDLAAAGGPSSPPSPPIEAPLAPDSMALPAPSSAPSRLPLPATLATRPTSALPAPSAAIAGQPAAAVPSYRATFGHQSYVKDGRNPALLKLMSRAIAAHPQLADGPLGQGVSRGHVGPQEVRALQSFLRSKGYSVGPKGIDGKFGPDTHAALAGMLNGHPPTAAPRSTPGAAPLTGPKPVTRPAAVPSHGAVHGNQGELKVASHDAIAPPSGSPAHGTPDRFTAVYDVSAHTVYLPDGTKLEAHSGLGANRDNPASEKLRDRGTTPQALYKLSPRGALFHGVAALRLTPISGNTFGRNGFLAHTYMLKRRGDSNGCVVFRNYPAFLHAYLSGQIKRLEVVSHR